MAFPYVAVVVGAVGVLVVVALITQFLHQRHRARVLARPSRTRTRR
ncbi:hypothetical protein AB2L27_08950 [Kineococcus sp. LSe6-4]|uniref:Uncharacterized protein n=1 Tax=Kineococcus halophytocola TaxID=3234027 RepID=A0ABV4H007_9ACTN